MGLFDTLLKGILRSGKSVAKGSAKVARSQRAAVSRTLQSQRAAAVKSSQKAAQKAANTAARATPKTKASERIIRRGYSSKPTNLKTRPKANTAISPPGYLRAQSEALAKSRTVKTAGKVAAGGLLLGGGILAAGSLGGKGLQSIGYGYRNLTDNRTPEEIRNDQLSNMARENELTRDRMEDLGKYFDFLSANGLTDSPTNRDVYNRYVFGEGPDDMPQQQAGGGNALVLLGGVALAGVAGYYLLKGNKKSPKKKSSTTKTKKKGGSRGKKK